MHSMTKKRLTRIARILRQNSTLAEDRLWRELRNRRLAGLKFKRQVPVGNYVADFLCHDARPIVELDGGHHAEQVEADTARADCIEADGFRILRFWNSNVTQNLDGVLEVIRTTPAIAVIRD